MTERAGQAAAFVRASGWGDAAWVPLAGDASARSYARLRLGAATAVLMDAPPGGADDTAAFVAMAGHLAGLGLSPPRILAQDVGQGFLLLEDLGDGIYARLIAGDAALQDPLYAAACDVLAHVQAHPATPGLPDLSAQDWAEAARLAPEVYARAVTDDLPDAGPLIRCLADLIARHADGPRVLILRDYHAENLLWLPGRAGLARVGLLDFQLGQMGQPGYDLVSLLQDARRDVPPGVEAAMIARFLGRTGRDAAGFGPAYAVLGAQRALRILGVFARLCLQGGKPQYLALMPRVWGQLQQNLAHPALAPLAGLCDRLIPQPTPARLDRIAAGGGTCPRP